MLVWPPLAWGGGGTDVQQFVKGNSVLSRFLLFHTCSATDSKLALYYSCMYRIIVRILRARITVKQIAHGKEAVLTETSKCIPFLAAHD